MATTFILGAGFSIPCEYPSGHNLNQKFFRNVEKNILKFSSGEWAWDDYDDVTSNNGRLNSEHLNISYLLAELVESFQNETLLPFAYEEFYDWLNETYSSDLIKTWCENVNTRLKKEFPSIPSSYLFNEPDINEYRRIQDSYEYLIADILKREYKRIENANEYAAFIKLLQTDSADVFTLNHDTLFEFLLEMYDVKYSDGFSTSDSIIIGDEKTLLPVFNNQYSELIKFYKLHGSIDYYLFSELIQSAGGVYYDTGKYWFFKTKRYWDTHTASKIDAVSKEIIQSLNPNIKPQFLTGKSKLSIINDHFFYKELYAHLKKSLQNADKLVIIGYSYRDIHINKLLKDFLNANTCEIINVNPFVEFPFKRNYSQHNILEVKSLSSL